MLRRLVRLLIGLLTSSIVAAFAFHALVASLSPALNGEASSSTPVNLQATLGTIAFEAFFVLLLGLVVGLPGFLLARRFGFANGLTATGLGLVVGLAVGAIYGDLDVRSLTAFLRAFVVFGLPGILAGASFWLFARRNGVKS